MLMKEVLNGYFKAWNDAFISKDGDEIRNYMSRNFIGYWAHSSLDEPDKYDFNYDLNQVLKQYENAVKSFEPFSITERKMGEEILVLGKEINIINGEPYPAQCMFVWRRERNEWKLLREYIELER